jgi:hypothetical protein
MLQYGLIIFCCSYLAGSCSKRKKLDERISLWRMDKIPYGTRYTYDNLSALFPEAVIRTSSRFPILFHGEYAKDTIRTLIILTRAFVPEPDEMNSMIRFASLGNQVFISASYIDDTVLSMLHLKPSRKESGRFDEMVTDSTKAGEERNKPTRIANTNLKTYSLAEISLLDPIRGEWKNYAYPGIFSENHFISMDTAYSRTLGKNGEGIANFVRLSYAHNGAIFVHLEPLAFSNFFLLHKENYSYYDLALSWLPEKTGVVEWSDYFRYRHRGENYSALHFILTNRSLRWAFWLTLILFLLIFLVESKRKQRAITDIPKLRNASADFVKTVGRLYFQQKNNQNLAGKMTHAFLENIRSAYNMPTSVLDEEFSRKLAFRTGKPLDEITDLMQSIHDARLNTNLTDREILDLHLKINQFNKPAT